MADDDQNDKELMSALQGGNLRAFETLMKRHKNYVFSVAARFLGNREDAEDLTQEVFCRVYTSRDTYEPTAKFSTFLYTIAARLCLNRIRDGKKRRHASLSPRPGFETTQMGIDPSDTVSANPVVALDREELGDKLQSALNSLPENQRIALLLFRYQELSYQEIGKTLNLSLPAVKSLIFRARAALADQLSDYLEK